MCTPVLRAIRKLHPHSHIAFLTEKESSDLLRLNPYLDEVIVLDKERYPNPFYSFKNVWQIRKKSFDLVMDFMGNPRSAYISFLSGAKRRIGYDLPFRRLFYNEIIENYGIPKYSAVHKLKALQVWGYENFDLKLDFFIPKEAELFAQRFWEENDLEQNHLTISISPTSRRHFRRWPLERFAQLSDWLISQFKAKIILVWGPGEREVVEKVKDRMKEPPIICEETKNLFQLGAVLSKCDLHFGNDNGTKHIAVALGKPTITIFGPEDPLSWTFPDFSQHRFLKKNVDCPDCDKIKHKCTQLSCLDQITMEDAQKTILQFLRETKERGITKKIEHLAVN